MIKLKYLVFFAVTVSILSLILSVLVFTQNSNVGRYQVFDSNSFVYIIDTKTSRLFIRSLLPCGGRVICYDFGTLDKPLYEDIVFNLQPKIDFVPDKTYTDIFDQITPDD